MSAKKMLSELKSLGKESGAKTYRRHGATGEVWGVSYADFGKIKKRIGVDQELADALWDSGVHDAGVLAAMVADPQCIAVGTLDRWARRVESHMLAWELGNLAGRSRHGRSRAEKWTRARSDLVAASGWNTVAVLAEGGAPRGAPEVSDPALDEDWFAARLREIEEGMEAAGNRTRYSMNTALIAIGARGGRLQKSAIAVARRIGKVEVDHGDTSCKTPDAESYILKTVKHRAELAARRAKKAASKKTTKRKTVKRKATKG
jgi:hypothetical protein